MGDKNNHVERLERLMNQLAESVLDLSDETILAETVEAGADPQQEVERTRAVLQQTSETLQTVYKHLWILGHTVNPKYWQQGERGYHNSCRDCGLSVNFTLAGNEMWGDALKGRCPERDRYAAFKREASGR